MRFTPDMAKFAQDALFAKAQALIGPKRSDYSGGADPFTNFRSSETVGVEAWRGAMVRWLDKIQRMRQLAEKGGEGEVKAESLVDTAADALNYCAITLSLIIEALPEEQAQRMLTALEFPAT
jgi:hypothetical protein